MQAPGWIKAALMILLAAVAGTTIFCVALMAEIDGAERRLARLEDTIDNLSAKAAAPTAEAGLSDDPAARLDSLENALGTLALKQRANTKRLDRLEAGDLGDLGIEALIDRKLDESIAHRGQGAMGKRPGIDELAERLGLDPRQKQAIKSLLDKAKGRVYEVMSADMGDGRDMMDRMTDIMREKGTREEKTRRILSDMFESTVPGSDDSYFSALMEIRSSSVSGFQGLLTLDQLSAFKNLEVDVFGIQTGYSPFSEELEQVLSGGK